MDPLTDEEREALRDYPWVSPPELFPAKVVGGHVWIFNHTVKKGLKKGYYDSGLVATEATAKQASLQDYDEDEQIALSIELLKKVKKSGDG